MHNGIIDFFACEKKKLKKASDTVTEEAKKTLGQMLLFDVELITYAICGRVKDILFSLVSRRQGWLR